ncbi:Ig-like domain-containing protein [Rhodococcus sp. NPDC049939]|uniref:Ig-like domain-containing protein n=1 Tax=Rhodococcus sp. NPDC049939 TaxID=3155511 RepID=UPI00340DE257
MRSSTLRRFAAPLVAGIAAAGLIVVGSGTAGAQEAPPPPSSNTLNDGRLRLEKEVVGDNVVHPGDTVTYKTSVSHNGGGIRLSLPWIRDYPPAGFELIRDSVKVRYDNSWNKANLKYKTDGGVAAECKSDCTFVVGGFDLNDHEVITLEATYRVPDDIVLGEYDSGAKVSVRTWSGDRGSKNFGVFVRVDDPNDRTATTVSVPATAEMGTPVDLVATVDPDNASGRIQFKDGETDIGAPVDVVGGVATLTHTFDVAGPREVTAVFLGNSGFYDSTSPSQTIEVTAETTTDLQVSQNPVLVGENVTATATVTPANAQGQVQFKFNGANYGAPVNVVNGEASLTRSFPEAQTYNVVAEFLGAPGYIGSVSAPVDVTVEDAEWGTTTTVIEPVTAVAGTPINLSATVLPIPSGGDVKFIVDGVEVGSAAVGSGDGVAVLPHTFATAGISSVVAEFGGTTGYMPSTSAVFAVAVTDPEPTREETTTSLKVTGKTEVGEELSFEATVDPTTANGTVEFKAGTVLLGTADVEGGVATLTHTFDLKGTYAVTANFVGGEGFADSVSGPAVLKVTEPDDPSNPGDPSDPGGNSSLSTGSLGG